MKSSARARARARALALGRARLRARDEAILELGAGTGWLALKMSSRFASWTATETTEGGALDRLERNLAKVAGGGTRGFPIARALDWNDAEGFVDVVGGARCRCRLQRPRRREVEQPRGRRRRRRRARRRKVVVQ